MERSSTQDFSLGQVQGKELHNLTIGVIGTGKIGKNVISSQFITIKKYI